ncbi:flagellar biosynthetic protein FliR [Desulfocurvus sp. DL9XJH121]
MDLFNFDPATMMSFLLTLFRVSIILFLLPFFGGNAIPNTVKASLCIVLSWAVWPHLSFPGSLMPSHPFQLALMLMGELVMGLMLMLVVRFLFAAVQMGGQVIGFMMGFSMINVVDPLTGTSVVITSHFLYMTTLLTFLSLGGHLYLLQGLADSFALVPPGGLFLNPEMCADLVRFAGQIYVLAIKISAPVMGAIFLVDLALALVGRAAPQMHVLILGFPVKITVGFFFLGILFTTLSLYVEDFISGMGPMFGHLLRLVAPH